MEAIEVKPKRTYQKHKTEKKITVKHFVNTSLCEIDEYENPVYPIYVEVIYNKKTTRFRSHIDTPQIINWYDGGIRQQFDLEVSNNPKYVLLKPKDSQFFVAINRDINTIHSIITEQVSLHPELFETNDLPKLYHSKYYSLSFFVDWCLKSEMENSMYLNREAFSEILPIFGTTSAFHKLQFYQSEYPNSIKSLSNVKSLYSSQIWHLDIFLDAISNVDNIKNWDSSIRMPENIYALYSLIPTVYDFKDGFFQEQFSKAFAKDELKINQILSDMKNIFSTYYEQFENSIVKEQCYK